MRFEDMHTSRLAQEIGAPLADADSYLDAYDSIRTASSVLSYTRLYERGSGEVVIAAFDLLGRGLTSLQVNT